MDKAANLARFKLSWYDYILYFPMAVPFIKQDAVAWWDSLGNDW